MDVSVCIVNWNTKALLRNCLESIRRSTHGVEYEVIVVDNDSEDGSAEMVLSDFPEVILIRAESNLGFSRGNNTALRRASANYVLFLNPDTQLVTNAVAGLWRFLSENPEFGAAGCKLLNSDGTIQLTCASAFPSARNELTSMLGLDRLFKTSGLLASRELGHWDHMDSREIECLSGACMMLPMHLARKLEGFDETTFMYGEDLDLCARIRSAGYRLYFLASETIYHHEGAGSRKRGRSFAPVRQRDANFFFLKKHFGALQAYSYRWVVLIGAMLRIAGVLPLLPLLALRTERRSWSMDFILRHLDLVRWSMFPKSSLAKQS